MVAIPSMEKQAQRVIAAVETIIRSLESDPSRIEHELTKPQLMTLFQLARKKCCTMTELSQLTGYAMSACTGIVDRMIRKKLVRRVRDDEDRRIVKVLATEKGLEAADTFYRKMLRNTMTVLERIEGGEREKLVLLLEKIANGFVKQL